MITRIARHRSAHRAFYQSVNAKLTVPVKAFPVVGKEGLALEADFIEELLTEPVPAKARINRP
jgi:hypothetical protein